MGKLCEDLWLLVVLFIFEIECLKFLVVVCFGIMVFFVVVCMMLIFDWILNGCLLVNVVVGGDLVELVGDGFFLLYDECYEVVDEFLDVWKGLLVGDIVNYEGKYIYVENSELLYLFV